VVETLSIPVELVWDLRCDTGESCTWDAATGCVLLCDIPAGRIHSWRVADGATQTWQLPELIGSFGVCRSGRLVVAFRDRVVLFDRATGSISELSGPLDQPATVRLNDGKVGADGAFWVGGRDESPAKTAEAALWRIAPDGRAERKAEGYQTCNGLAWSADGTVMFHTDSRRGRLDAWDFDAATGAIANRRVLATLTEEQGRPDGGATDAEGGYWSAGISAGCLNRFSAAGALLARVPMPVPVPSMPCFAGDWIYVSTSRGGKDAAVLAAHPTLGGLFRLRAPVQGAPVALFADA
jgi:sugar lactone lactonase YvrE